MHFIFPIDYLFYYFLNLKTSNTLYVCYKRYQLVVIALTTLPSSYDLTHNNTSIEYNKR